MSCSRNLIFQRTWSTQSVLYSRGQAGLGDYSRSDRRQLLSETKTAANAPICCFSRPTVCFNPVEPPKPTALRITEQVQEPEVVPRPRLAETARANGDAACQVHYSQLIGETDNADYKVDAYLELEQCTEQDDLDSSIQAYQSVLTSPLTVLPQTLFVLNWPNTLR